jgi:hypothetical protein
MGDTNTLLIHSPELVFPPVQHPKDAETLQPDLNPLIHNPKGPAFPLIQHPVLAKKTQPILIEQECLKMKEQFMPLHWPKFFLRGPVTGQTPPLTTTLLGRTDCHDKKTGGNSNLLSLSVATPGKKRKPRSTLAETSWDMVLVSMQRKSQFGAMKRLKIRKDCKKEDVAE